MAARPSALASVKSPAQANAAWTQQFLLYALLFASLMVLHAPLLRLPYFWDEAGYYIPVARDLYLTGSPIPHSTLSNAHPPLVMAWLALAWRLFGYSTLVTRTAILALAGFSLLGLFRLARRAANLHIAAAVTVLTAVYPVFFTQSAMALVDLPAAGLAFWALASYLEDRPWSTVLWFSLAAMAKETAVVAPLALLSWELLAPIVRSRRAELALPLGRRTRAIHLILPIMPLVCWFAFHRAKTGFVFGNPDFFRYNVAGTLNPLRIPIALGLRLWQVGGYFGLWLLSLSVVLAMLRPPQIENGHPRRRIEILQQAAIAAVILAYLVFMSAVGGAPLARYLLPVTPLVILLSVAALSRRLRYWKLVAGALAVTFVAGLFSNPPYGFSLEDNLAYRDFVVMHSEASRFMTMRYPNATVLTAWPASDELNRPWLGYVARPFRVVRIEDFTAAQIDVAYAARSEFDVAFVFSTKYQPRHELLANWAAWQEIKARFFGYHRDLLPEEIARRMGGRIVFHKEENGLWVAVIALDKEQDAQLRLPADYPPSR